MSRDKLSDNRHYVEMIVERDKEIDRLREALGRIEYMHDGNMPDAMAGSPEVDYARRVIGNCNRIAREALSGK